MTVEFIPVDGNPQLTPPTLAELREMGADLYEEKWPEIRAERSANPALVANMDQRLAAEKDELMKARIAGSGEPRMCLKKVTPAGAALSIGIVMSILRNVTARCSHVPWPVTDEAE